MASEPCTWSVDPSCNETVWNAASGDDQQRAAQFATLVLWASTGRQYGLCDLTVRPCVSQFTGQFGYFWDNGTFMPYMPYLWGGQWFNAPCCCDGMCCCGARPFTEVRLLGPVAGIIAVTIDGTLVDPSVYRVDNQQTLVRQDGDRWPICTDYNLPAGEVGTWTVEYCQGTPVPPALTVAAGSLAVEFLKACAGSACRLPGRVTSVVRSGVSVTMVDLDTLFKLGLTGLVEVDMVIRSLNPNGLTHRSRVYTPDVTYPRITTSP